MAIRNWTNTSTPPLVSLDRDERKALYNSYFTEVMANTYLANIAFKPAVAASRPEVNGVQFLGGRLLFEIHLYRVAR